MRVTWLGLALMVACGGGATGHQPAVDDTTSGGSNRGGGKAQAGSQAASDAGAAGEPVAEGGAAEGGASSSSPALETAGAPDLGPPSVCDPTLSLGDAQPLSLGESGLQLLSTTSDELSVAFLTGSGADAVLHVADRAAKSADFAEVSVTLPATYEAVSGVSLSGDGRRLMLVHTGHGGFGELIRSARGADFSGAADTTRFAKLNILKGMTGNSLGWPVLSNDGHDLYYVSYFGKALVVQASAQADGNFDFGAEIDEFTLGGEEGKYKLLSGLAADQRAIFYFDEDTGHSAALFRSHPGAPFYSPLDLGARHGAAPSQDCDRIYSSVASGLVLQARR
jgi:hypothetical protein